MMQNAYTDWFLCLAWVKKESAVLRGATLSGADADWWCKKISQCEKFRIRCKNVFFPKTTLNFSFYVVNLSSLVLFLAHSFFCPLYTQGKILFFAFEVKIYHVKQVRLNTWGWCWLRRGDTDCLWGWCSLPWSVSECLVWYWMLMQNISHRRYAMQKISHAVQKSLFLVQDVGYPSKNSLSDLWSIIQEEQQQQC